jgi:hypothetical protein
MTDTTRRTPTPTDVAARAAGVPPEGVVYERTRWEAAVLQRRLHHTDTLIALVLAHYAGPGGVLPQDGIQRTERLREVTRTSSEAVRVALRNLTKARLIERLPYSAGASPAAARAIVLTVPARRERPPHTGTRP